MRRRYQAGRAEKVREAKKGLWLIRTRRRGVEEEEQVSLQLFVVLILSPDENGIRCHATIASA
jgi:hypothetical protein